MDWQWGGILAASSQPRRTVISVPSTSLACSSGGRLGSGCYSGGCNRWLCCGRVWKSHNTCITRLSSKGSLAARQLSGVEHSGVDRQWGGILAASIGPCCTIISVPSTSLACSSGGRLGSGCYSGGCNRWLRCWRVWKSHNACITRLSSKGSLAARQLSGIERSGVVWQGGGILAASIGPCRSIISVPTTTLACNSGGRLRSGCYCGGCNRWLCRGRVWKSHNTRITRLSSERGLAALQLSGEERCGRDWMRQGVLATSLGPWGRIIGVELANVGVCRSWCGTDGSAAGATCLPTVLSGTTRRLIGVAGGITVRHLNTARCGPRLRVVSV